jgi:hypothetical protein
VLDAFPSEHRVGSHSVANSFSELHANTGIVRAAHHGFEVILLSKATSSTARAQEAESHALFLGRIGRLRSDLRRCLPALIPSRSLCSKVTKDPRLGEARALGSHYLFISKVLAHCDTEARAHFEKHRRTHAELRILSKRDSSEVVVNIALGSAARES